MEALAAIDAWDAHPAAAGVVGRVEAVHGDEEHVFAWASVTKLLTGLTFLVALEEGTVDLDEPAGPPGATLRHLLSHASGLPLDGAESMTEPGRRRIYSNEPGILEAARASARPGHPEGACLHPSMPQRMDARRRSWYRPPSEE